jgi:hypothetical protein
MPATTEIRNNTVALLRRRRCDRVASVTLTTHPNDRDGVEQCHQCDEHGDQCAIARAYCPLPLLL